MALIVFDDLDFFSMIKPSISAVAQPAYEIGEQAMRLLMKQIEASGDCPTEVVTLPTTLVLRESV
jgi:LacI family transcriptional regulator